MSTKRQSGLTMIELVIFMVIVGVAAAGIIGVLNIGGSHSADPLRRKQALMIAEALMEEVLLARFTYCDPTAANADTAANQAACGAQQLAIGIPAGGRPYGNVANYATAAGVASRTFTVNGSGVGPDLDINGRALGTNAGNATIGNAALAGITTTVTLNYLVANADPNLDTSLGPAGSKITSLNTDIRGLRITLITTYGTGANDFVQLDAYRTRYAPTYLP
jgi:MSHA pilin protein MshD